MKKVLKRIGKIIGSLFGLVVVAAAAVLAIGYFRFHKTYDIVPHGLQIPTDQASIARGEHLVSAVAHCELSISLSKA